MEMTDILDESEWTEARAFAKEIVVRPGSTLIRYTFPVPSDGRISSRNAEDVTLNGSVLHTRH